MLVPFRYHWYAGDAPPLTGVGVNVTVEPEHTGPTGEAEIVTVGVTGDVKDKLAKLVNVVMPAIPGGTDGVEMVPAAADVEVACTCRPVIENWSIVVMPLVVILIVSVVAVMVPVMAMIFAPVV